MTLWGYRLGGFFMRTFTITVFCFFVLTTSLNAGWCCFAFFHLNRVTTSMVLADIIESHVIKSRDDDGKDIYIIDLNHIGTNLIGTLLEEIDVFYFENHEQVRELKSQGNFMRQIPDEMLKFTHVIALDFQNNLIKSIPTKLGTKLRDLQSINLSRNRITDIPGGFFEGLTNLRFLYLSENRIKHIPSKIQHLLALEVLFLDHNWLEDVPSVIGLISNLRGLRLDHNSLTALPEQFGQLYRLRDLHLEHNELTTLPLGMSGLRRLKALYLSENSFELIPRVLGALEGLVLLDLSRNRIRIVDHLQNLSQLEVLCLEENPLDGINGCISDKPGLEVIVSAYHVAKLLTPKRLREMTSPSDAVSAAGVLDSPLARFRRKQGYHVDEMGHTSRPGTPTHPDMPVRSPKSRYIDGVLPGATLPFGGPDTPRSGYGTPKRKSGKRPACLETVTPR